VGSRCSNPVSVEYPLRIIRARRQKKLCERDSIGREKVAKAATCLSRFTSV
jgi:hypothetical protein